MVSGRNFTYAFLLKLSLLGGLSFESVGISAVT